MNLEHKRHSLAHLLAAAVKELYPSAKPTIGPAIENGFYYDFEFSTPISDKDLENIENKMKELLPSWTSFEGREVSAQEARTYFKDNQYKLELIDELVQKEETITFYTSGNFTDLCRGGHVHNPATDITPDSFTLDRIAGAYWRGIETNTMLTRIYGLAFDTKEELATYLTHREEAQKRDHRKLGQELDLFTFSDLVGPGLPLFTPKGTLIRDLIVEKISSIQSKLGYQKVTIPHITKKELYQTSGHWDKFGDELFKVKGKGDTEFVMKPMNCPHHTQIYAARPRSYKDLPLRFAETTMVYRDEQQGELLGLARVRSITQDDGHVFCRPDQISQEIENIVHVIKQFYTSLNMFEEGKFWVSLSVRDSAQPEKYLGDSTLWDKAEGELEAVAQKLSLPYKRVEGEAAFYGPKLDFMFEDALGRERQLATAQLDFVMPTRFELAYTDQDGTKQRPVMIHRAIAGSLERFMAVMIEHFAGAFPLWLSPVQIKILPISDAHHAYAHEIAVHMNNAGFRTELDDRHEGLGKKIRSAKEEKIPYIFVIGDKEVEDKTITIEGRNEKIGTKTIEDTVLFLHAELAENK